MAFELPNLPYAHDALEPHIDAKTMEIHHGKHHNAYTTNLNNAIDDTDLANSSIGEIRDFVYRRNTWRYLRTFTCHKE